MTKLQQKATITTNKTPGSVCTVTVPAVKFAVLWAGYPSGHPYQDPKTGKTPAGFENQCAIKVSGALHAAGVEMKSFKSASITMDGKKAAIRASELAAWLKLQPFCGLPTKPEVVTGKDWQAKIKGRTGIIYFEDYWARPGETKNPSGDHIDLWNGDGLTPNAANRARSLGFNSVQWLPWPLDGLNFSDLANSKQIIFWEIK
jgi:hypothetical protein